MNSKTLFASVILLAITFLGSCQRPSPEALSTPGENEELLPDKPEPENPVVEIEFSYEQGTFANVALPYRKAEIARDGDESQKAALVLYLHGGTSKGNDNEAQMKEDAVGVIAEYLASNNISSVFLVPQCPKDKSWGKVMNPVLKGLLDSQVSNGYIDTERLYIFGGSMGGTGTWNFLSAFPNMFAAAMPVAGNPTGCNAANVATTPVLTVMGTEDKIMDISVVENFLGEIAAQQGTAVLQVEEGWSHETTCISSYTSERLDWVFSYPK